MKQLIASILFFLFYISSSFALTQETITYKGFGKIVIYHPSKPPTSVALFISGDGGWQFGVINMAKNIAAQGALVAGIDAKQYARSLSKLSAACYYPAADFERLSLMLQKKYKFANYTKPVLIGYSYGAVLVYGLLAQAPANTFKGAIAIGFCPDIDLKKPLCEGNGLTSHILKAGKSYYLDRTQKLTAPFIALNGLKDVTCPFAATKEFLKNMPFAELVTLPKIGHGFSIAGNWLPQFNLAYNKILQTPSYTDVKVVQNGLFNIQNMIKLPGDLPLTIVPALPNSKMPMVFMISGDGGWTSFDHTLAETFAKKGIPVVGLDAQKYFWNAKTPQETTVEITKAVSHYLQQWNKKSFILVGYSFGACVAPFVANRFPDFLKKSLSGICLISPEEFGDFEIHVSDMLSIGSRNKQFDVLSEIRKIKEIKPVCIFGEEEDPLIRQRFESPGVKIITLPGSHHFNNNYSLIVENILKNIFAQ